MTRAKTLPILARDVMGWPITHEWDGRVGVGEPRVTVTGHTVEGKEPYDPWTNVQQALALAEAWRKQEDRDPDAHWEYRSPDKTAPLGEVTLWDSVSSDESGVATHKDVEYSSYASTLAATLTGAVCEALELKVTNAQ